MIVKTSEHNFDNVNSIVNKCANDLEADSWGSHGKEDGIHVFIDYDDRENKYAMYYMKIQLEKNGYEIQEKE